MKSFCGPREIFLFSAILLGIALCLGESAADPAKYPQFTQQQLPKGVMPDFIHLDQMVDEIVSGKKPLIIDVRSDEEYAEAHIKAAISVPLSELPLRLTEIPRDKPLVLY